MIQKMPQARATARRHCLYGDVLTVRFLNERPSYQSTLELMDWFDPSLSPLLDQDTDRVYSPFQLAALVVVEYLARSDERKDSAECMLGYLMDHLEALLRLYNLLPAQFSEGAIFNLLKFVQLLHELGVFQASLLRKALTALKKSHAIPFRALPWYDFELEDWQRESLCDALENTIQLAFGRG